MPEPSGAVARPTDRLSAPASAAILGTAARLRLFRKCGTVRVRHRRSRSAMCLPAVSGCAPLLTPRRKRSQRASWISGHLALVPGAGRLHVTSDGAIHVPSLQTTSAW
jgi:hypothetical protein